MSLVMDKTLGSLRLRLIAPSPFSTARREAAPSAMPRSSFRRQMLGVVINPGRQPPRHGARAGSHGDGPPLAPTASRQR